MSADAYHITAPSEDGDGARPRRWPTALAERRHRRRTQVDYINAHGTSTPHNDTLETLAIKRCFGEHAHKLAVSSTKSMTGHLLGAAGGLEAGITALAVHHQIAPPTINLDAPGLRSATSTTCRNISAADARSTTRCRTRSASAAPTRRCCSSDSRNSVATAQLADLLSRASRRSICAELVARTAAD